MPRPIKLRRVFFDPNITYFKPQGIPIGFLGEVTLSIDELESIRLSDFEGLDQVKAAKKMNISQPTFYRLLKSARKKVAQALIKGNALRIEGGAYKMVGRGMGFGRGRGIRGRMGGPFAAGPEGTCICPKCKNEVLHQVGIPCYQMKCPKCGSPMMRK